MNYVRINIEVLKHIFVLFSNQNFLRYGDLIGLRLCSVKLDLHTGLLFAEVSETTTTTQEPTTQPTTEEQTTACSATNIDGSWTVGTATGSIH